MKRIIATYCFYLLFFTSIGQNSNPFELQRDSISVESSPDDASIIDKSQTLEPAAVSLDKIVTNSTKNPFDVESTREDIVKKPIFRPLEKTIANTDQSEITSENFLFWFLLLSLVLLTLGITRDRKSFGKLYKLISNNNYLKLVNRDLNGGKMVFYVILYAMFFIIISIYIYQYVSKNHGISGFSFFIRVLGIVLLIYTIRHIAMFLASQFTLTTQLLSDYNFLIVISNILCGLLLFPVVILVSYSPLENIFLIVGLIIIAICYLMRQGNGILTALKEKQANLFHFFIYICTFEIAPALIIIKLIQSYSGAM